MKNKFVKTIASFQIYVNIIGLPIYYEIKKITIENNSKFIGENKSRYCVIGGVI